MPFSFPSRPDQKARRRNSSAKAASQSQIQTQARMLPYRDTDNKSIAYAAPKPSSSSNTPPPPAADEEEEEEEEESPPFSSSSDAEPLVSQQQSSAPNKDDQAAALPAGLSEYDMQHFTATGRPAPLRFRASSLASMAGDMHTVPQLLPKRYTDDSIIPAIITDVIPSSPASSASPSPSSNIKAAAVAAEEEDVRKMAREREEEEKKKKKEKPEGGKLGGLLGKLKGGGSTSRTSGKRGDADKMLKVVYMPRREYQKWFARDEKGCYIGSEEHRRWTEGELEAAFGRYKPEPPTKRKKKEGLLSGSGSGAGTLGALNAVGGRALS